MIGGHTGIRCNVQQQLLVVAPTVPLPRLQLCHTSMKENRMNNYMYTRIKFHTYKDIMSE